VRDVDALSEVAEGHGFALAATHSMPANNLLLVWGRGGVAQMGND
jgi:hypothetical protein